MKVRNNVHSLQGSYDSCSSERSDNAFWKLDWQSKSMSLKAEITGGFLAIPITIISSYILLRQVFVLLISFS